MRDKRALLVAGSLALGASLLAATPAASAADHVVPGSIASDCSHDVTGEITSWVRSVPDGSTVSFGAGACYRVDGTIKIAGRDNLVIDGRGATFRAFTDGRESEDPRTRSQIYLFDSDNITIRNTRVVGPHNGTSDESDPTRNGYVAELEAQHAYNIIGSNNVVLENIYASKTYGDFVYISKRPDVTALNTNITVRNSSFYGSGRQGITVTAGDTVLIENNNIRFAGRATIDLEPNTERGTLRNIIIRNNRIEGGRLLFVANAGVCSDVRNLRIENNTLHNRSMGIWSRSPGGCPYTRGPIVIRNNTSDAFIGSANGAVMRFTRTRDIEVSGNRQPMQPNRDMHFVTAHSDTSDIRVTDNVLLHASHSLRIDGENVSDYCYSGNLVGDPLFRESTDRPCSRPPRPTTTTSTTTSTTAPPTPTTEPTETTMPPTSGPPTTEPRGGGDGGEDGPGTAAGGGGSAAGPAVVLEENLGEIEASFEQPSFAGIPQVTAADYASGQPYLPPGELASPFLGAADTPGSDTESDEVEADPYLNVQVADVSESWWESLADMATGMPTVIADLVTDPNGFRDRAREDPETRGSFLMFLSLIVTVYALHRIRVNAHTRRGTWAQSWLNRR